MAQVCPLIGSVRVLGYQLKADNIIEDVFKNHLSNKCDTNTKNVGNASEHTLQFYPIFSPKSSSLLSIESVSIQLLSFKKAQSQSIIKKSQKSQKSKNNIPHPIVSNFVSDSTSILESLLDMVNQIEGEFSTLVCLMPLSKASGLLSIEKKSPIFKDIFTQVRYENNEIRSFDLKKKHFFFKTAFRICDQFFIY